MKNMQTLEGRFVYFTECQLATLETLERRKRVSKSDIMRQQGIANAMMLVVKESCQDVQIVACPRVQERLRTSIVELSS